MECGEEIFMLKVLKNKTNYEKLGITLVILSIIFLIISSVWGLLKVNTWYDELFSITMVSVGFKNMLTVGVNDVHPLLYYVIFYLFAKFFSIFNFTNLEQIGVIVSLIPFYLLIILGLTKIRENFGWLTSGIFCFCIIAMPQLLEYSVEVRMYSWALFFLTAIYILFYEINKNPTRKKWILLTILTICSAYTQYFAAVESFCLYVVFFAYFLFKKREYVKNIIISGIIIILSYIPWIPSLITQITKVHTKFWIDPINLNTIIGYFYYIFSPFNAYIIGNKIIRPDLLGTLVIISFIVVIIYYYRNMNKNIGLYPLLGLISVILMSIIGISISTIYSPIFYMRYLIPVLGIIYLSFSILLDNIKENKKILIPIIVLILIIGIVDMGVFITEENNNFEKENQIKELYASTVPDGSIIIYDNPADFFSSKILEGNYTTYYLGGFLKLGNILNPDILAMNKNEGKYLENVLDNMKNENKDVFIVGLDKKYEDLISEGYNITLIKSYESRIFTLKDNSHLYHLNNV